jgi:hypothetical protein
VSELQESGLGAAPLRPHQFISLMVFDLSGARRLSVEAHVQSTSSSATTHELMLDWEDAPSSIVSYPAGDRWTAAQEVLLEVASLATSLELSSIEPGHWDRIMLRVPGPDSGPTREFILEMRRTGSASLWLRGDAFAKRYWLSVQDCRWALDCVSALALVFGDMLEQRADLLGRAASDVGRRPA